MSDAWPALVPEGEAAPPMAWLEAVRGAEGMSVNAQGCWHCGAESRFRPRHRTTARPPVEER